MVKVADDAEVPAARQEERATVGEHSASTEPVDGVPPDPFTDTPEPSERTARRRLTNVRHAASQSRRFLTAVLGEAGLATAVVNDAQTVVSEFVIEALARGRPPRFLDVRIGQDELRIELVAEGRCEPLDADASRQISTDLVARITVSSGSRPITDGRVWWALLPVQSPIVLPASSRDEAGSVER
jgi:hypothetical protein